MSVAYHLDVKKAARQAVLDLLLAKTGPIKFDIVSSNNTVLATLPLLAGVATIDAGTGAMTFLIGPRDDAAAETGDAVAAILRDSGASPGDWMTADVKAGSAADGGWFVLSTIAIVQGAPVELTSAVIT